MKFDELKDILRLRGLRESWKESELVARIFVAKKQQTTEGGSRYSPVILVPSLFSASFSIGLFTVGIALWGTGQFISAGKKGP